MSNLTGTDQTALLVVDVQNAVVGTAWQRDEVVGRIGDLVQRARLRTAKYSTLPGITLDATPAAAISR
jgi:hypothetical protein